jgi:hypothetical protein
MFSWIPRWHPFVWLIVIVIVVAIWTNPAEWGHKAGGLFHLIPEIASRATIFVQSL